MARFPRSPEITSRPFDDGPNPFAEENGTPLPISQNPLSSPSTAEWDGKIQPYKPADYIQTLPDRSGRTMTFGLIGAAFIAISVVIAVVVFLNAPLWSAELVFCWPADLVGLAFTIPAWSMAAADLRAMRAGAMDQGGLRRTRIGYWCGLFGTIIGAAPFVLTIVTIVLAIAGY